MTDNEQDKSTRASRSDRKRKLRELQAMLIKAAGDAVFSRQVEEVDDFSGMYDQFRLLEPPYSFQKLYTVYEESDVLQECIDAYIQNVDGFGYQLNFLGDDLTERDSKDRQAEKIRLENFFDYANEEQSWRTIRKLMREDLEVIGNGAIEIVRNNAGSIQMSYYLPFRKLRISAFDSDPVEVTVNLMRDGKMIPVKVQKYFRKFAAVNLVTGKRIRWFKTFGDPRSMDALTGEYKANPKIPASEILHFKLPFGGSVYGLPRWVSAVLDTIGRRAAQYVNYDLFESQGIPPMAVMVSGGVLTDESYDELESLVRGMRGVERWNKVLILESNVESVGIEEKGSAKIELKNLAEYRKEDQMFERYLAGAEKTIRHRFRLPPLYVGAAESFTHATAKAAETVVEEQVFIPERDGFDEEINRKIVHGEFGITAWSYKSKGPRAVGSEEITKGVRAFMIAGALTVNHAVDLANRAFGLDMSKYKGKWADYPINLVLELIKSGRLKGMEEVDTGEVAPAAPEPKQITGKPMPQLPVKVFKSDMFTEEERALYKQLITIQHAIERGIETGKIEPEELEQEAL
jgi:PBSX family phage portal protein